MKYIKLGLWAISLVCFCTTGLNAQEVIPASGGNASGTGGSVSYSVGQVVYTSNVGTNGSEIQGVQQVFEIITETGLEENSNITLQVSAYPNPVTDYLVLKIENENIKGVNYQLFDITGKLLAQEAIEYNETRIVMSNLLSAIYYLNVGEGDKVLKVFKIIKK